MPRAALLIGVALVTGACAPDAPPSPMDFPGVGAGKVDTLGRGLVGIASDYEAAELDAELLRTDMAARREAAWASVQKVLEPVPLLGLAEDAHEHEEIELPDGEIPKVARWQTWYGTSDIKRMFQHLYEELTPADRVVRASFDRDAVKEAFRWNAGTLERSQSWPLERYFAYLRSLGLCADSLSDAECAAVVESRFGGAASGTTRTLYSPAAAEKLLTDYATMLDCLETLPKLDMGAKPAADENFTTCFASEFAPNSVLIKAQWQRADFGRPVAVHDTDADALKTRLGQSAQWATDGDRQQQPDPSEIVTIRLRGGDTYRLVGLHIMTKELRHWQWITLWWSDTPDSDFGADRPQSIGDAAAPWSNYKMCVVGSFEEGDESAAERFENLPTLAGALDATSSETGSTWCSNPYIEHGRGNAETNCIGCHQHGGAVAGFDNDGDDILEPFDLAEVIASEALYPDRGRKQIREVFPADYLFSFNRAGDVVHILEGEVGFWDGVDESSVRARSEAILRLEGAATEGALIFESSCAACHGSDGHGTDAAPNLLERVPFRDDSSLLQTLLAGRGLMPAWAETLSNQQTADVLAHLRASFVD